MHVGQAAINAVVVEGEALVVDTEQVKHWGTQITPLIPWAD